MPLRPPSPARQTTEPTPSSTEARPGAARFASASRPLPGAPGSHSSGAPALDPAIRRGLLGSIAALMLLFGSAGCDSDQAGGDAGPDARLFDLDGGPDAGVDAGVDAGPPPTFAVRVAHDLPGMTGTEALPGSAHLCAWLFNGDRIVPVPPQFLTQSTGPIPFRGVSPYVPFASVAPLDYVLGVYEPADVAGGCPAHPEQSEVEPALLGRLTPDQVPENSVSTATLTGLLSGSFGAESAELPSLCDPTPDPAPFDAPCPEALAASLMVAPDDRAPPAEGMARLRVSQQIPNIAPVGFNVCYEASLAPDPEGPAGSCVDTVPDDTPELLFANVTYGTVTEYVERAPITPTVPSMGIGGAIYLVPETTGSTGCPPFSALGEGQRCLPILAAWPSPQPSPNIQPHLGEGHVSTLFITGVLGLGGADAEAFGSTMFLWQDNLTSGE